MARRPGFTLIEVLTVITVIGILISVSVFSWSSIAAKSRDNTRKTDLARLSNVLEQYRLANRSYPDFAVPEGDYRIYGASWQLADSDGGDRCPLTGRLAPTFITVIPQDPRDSSDYSGTCDQLQSGQANRYLYISAPANEESGPSRFAAAYALFATLERPTLDETLLNSANPLWPGEGVAPFGRWYAVNNYAEPYRINANYMIVGGNLRTTTE